MWGIQKLRRNFLDSRGFLVLKIIIQMRRQMCSIQKLFLKITHYSQKNNCWSLFLIKLQALRSATLLKRDFSTGVFLCILRISIYFEKHLRTAASDYSFTIVIYLFSAVSLQVRRKTTIFEIRRSLKLDYAIQDV